MRKRHRHALSLVLTMPLVWLVACAAAPTGVRPDAWKAQAAVQESGASARVAAAMPLLAAGGAPVFASELSFAAIESKLQLRSEYRLLAGDLLTPTDAPRWHSGAKPQSLGTQSIVQDARLTLPGPAGAPLQVGMRYEQTDQWLAQSALQQLRQQLDVRWSPGSARVQVQWDAEGLPRDARNALDCALRGQLSIPVSAETVDLQLRGRDCEVDVADHVGLRAHTWSAGVHWNAGGHSSTVRVLNVDAQPLPQALRPDVAAYEFGFEHARTLGDWVARAGVAWRALDAPATAGGDVWVTDASLRRDLGLLTLAAQWQNGDRYWFLPGYSLPADDLSLNLDLSRWAALHWPGLTPALALSYQWQRRPASGYDDATVRGQISLPWR